MYLPADPKLWQGRVDAGDGAAGRRWHQVVGFDGAQAGGVALLGFASDLGVVRNQGRPGAVEGPAALRRALANCAWHFGELPVHDAGDVRVKDDLEQGQEDFAARLTGLLAEGAFVIGLGGGHELGWASYLGCRRWLDRQAPGKVLGVLNLDAHFDLRSAPVPSSGTPFYQAAEHCRAQGQDFRYACIGIARASNTPALYTRASELGVDYLPDLDCQGEAGVEFFRRFLQGIDYLYLTCCLDVFPAACAPGVSAPAALGVDPRWLLQTLVSLGRECREAGVGWLMTDVAELSPSHDRDGVTAKLGARLIDELVGSLVAGGAPGGGPVSGA